VIVKELRRSFWKNIFSNRALGLGNMADKLRRTYGVSKRPFLESPKKSP
jgi:hypothetical protein